MKLSIKLKKIQQRIILNHAFKKLCGTPLIYAGSGKGGSGKTTLAAIIAIKLSSLGYKIGVGDFDQTANFVSALGKDPTEYELKRDNWNRYIPLQINDNLKVMSFQLLKSQGEGYYLTGKNLAEHIYQLLYSTSWGKLDYFITDNPSGSYDSLETQRKLFRKLSVILITEPHQYSISNCEEFIDNCRYSGINIFGLVVNETHYICPCGHKAYLRGKPGKARELAGKYKIEFLGGIPTEERIAEGDISHLINNGFTLRAVKLITDKNWKWR